MKNMKIVTLAAVSVLGLGAIGGAAVKANANTSPAKNAAPPVVQTVSANNEAASLPDADNVQQNVQQGDQTSPDAATATLTSSVTATSSEQATAGTSSEQAGTETAANSDGPGGHADPAGANVDHQFQGQE